MFLVYISLHIVASFKHNAVTKEVPIDLKLYVFYLKILLNFGYIRQFNLFVKPKEEDI
jgi:hypothetical protein